jgi:methyl-accepting chemotaxis protein
MVEEQTAASHTLAQEAGALDGLLRQFKLGQGQADTPRTMVAGTASRPVASPARALTRSVAKAFGGKAATAAAVQEDWTEF